MISEHGIFDEHQINLGGFSKAMLFELDLSPLLVHEDRIEKV
jgi:hypothetical protein